MTTNILKQTLVENCNGVEKGSSKRVIAYLFALVICFISVYSVVTGGIIPIELIGTLITNLLILLGISAYTGKVNPPTKAIVDEIEKKV